MDEDGENQVEKGKSVTCTDFVSGKKLEYYTRKEGKM